MCVTSNVLSVVLCVLLMCVQFFYSYPGKINNAISVQGNFISLSENKVLVKLGEAPNILCTGRDAYQLVLFTEDHANDKHLRALPAIVVNATTIGFFMNKTEIPEKLTFVCKDFSVPHRESVTLLFDGPPHLTNFRCVSKNLDFLKCTWNTSNIFASFSVHVIFDDQPIKICDIPVPEANADIDDLTCIWDTHRKPRYAPGAATIRLLVQHCNYTHCLNRTYDFDHLSIVKLDPPKVNVFKTEVGLNLKINVQLTVQIPMKTFKLLDGIVERVELRNFPSWREMESRVSTFYGNQFVVEIELPCSSRNNQVRVFVKTEQAERDACWSDYADVSVETENTDVVDAAACEMDEIPVTPEVMVYVLDKFRKKFETEQSQLKRKINKSKVWDAILKSNYSDYLNIR